MGAAASALVEMVEAWNLLLVHPLLSLLVGAYDLVRDFGLAIVLVTIGIRLVLYPLFVAQIRSQRAMQELAPALNELKAKYGKDRQRLSEEQMKLYRERGANPAMGCLPLLVQMPILFAMYSAFIQAGCGLGKNLGVSSPPQPYDCVGPLTRAEIDTIRFPFIPNPLEEGARLDTSAVWLPWMSGGLQHTDPLFVLPALAGLTQLVASLMAQPTTQARSADPQARMMQSMVYYFPIITVVIAAGLPAGLSLYWVATTVFQIVQQYFVSGWGQLARWLPLLRAIPTPADRTLARAQQAAIAEAEADMRAAGARPTGPGAQRAGGGAPASGARSGEHADARRRGRKRRRR